MFLANIYYSLMVHSAKSFFPPCILIAIQSLHCQDSCLEGVMKYILLYSTEVGWKSDETECTLTWHINITSSVVVLTKLGWDSWASKSKSSFFCVWAFSKSSFDMLSWSSSRTWFIFTFKLATCKMKRQKNIKGTKSFQGVPPFICSSLPVWNFVVLLHLVFHLKGEWIMFKGQLTIFRHCSVPLGHWKQKSIFSIQALPERCTSFHIVCLPYDKIMFISLEVVHGLSNNYCPIH